MCRVSAKVRVKCCPLTNQLVPAGAGGLTAAMSLLLLLVVAALLHLSLAQHCSLPGPALRPDPARCDAFIHCTHGVGYNKESFFRINSNKRILVFCLLVHNLIDKLVLFQCDT